ncbi:hypothetical protein [Marinomonas ostreistagni]|uniref:Chromosome partition protein Smc n=1 Tax=Marinomonas ostreistagni TaxID=359209 RepID=A0ABS0Z732_9GAMM|nr:hypothetical protein [Marinomonas ostreistagni]MBJ7549470.1 hypothetical protein [Marinomonas ostreistagni]
MRKDDDVEIPSLTLDQDELSARSGAASTQKAGRQRLNPPPARPASANATISQAPVKKTSLAFVYFLMLLIVSAIAGGGYWLWLENQKLRSELLGARSQIQDLDSQLVAADVSNSKQGETVEERLANHESEIRKLWGISYDRNRKAISVNDQEIEQLENKLAELRDVVSTQGKRVAIQADTFNDVENGYNRMLKTLAEMEKGIADQAQSVQQTRGEVVAQINEQKSATQSVTSQVSGLESQLAILKRSLTALEKSINSQSKTIATLSEAPATPAIPSDLTSRLSNAEEAIRSIDEFRPQVLREINSLKAQVRQMSLELSIANGG